MIDTLKPWLAWGAGGAVLAGLIALAVMNPIAAARLASAASGWLLDTGRSVVTWARDPERNWWKIGCFAFASFFTLAAMVANEQRQQVVATVAACEVTVKGVKDESDGRLSELVKAQGNFLVCQKALDREVGLPAMVAELNAAAVVKAQAQAKAAQRELADFKKRYGAKPATCTAALAEVEKQCASLSDY